MAAETRERAKRLYPLGRVSAVGFSSEVTSTLHIDVANVLRAVRVGASGLCTAAVGEDNELKALLETL